MYNNTNYMVLQISHKYTSYQQRNSDEITDRHHHKNNLNRVFYIDVPGGTGKTYLKNAILLSYARSQG